MKKLKLIPKFKNEDEERAFWAKNDSTDYVDWSKAKKVIFPNLCPSSKTISLRLSDAHKRDVPYQSYMKMILSENI